MNNENNDEMYYVISDIEKFVNETRKIVFGGFGKDIEENNVDDFIAELTETDIEDLNKTLTQEECMAIVHTHIKPRKTKSGKTKYLMSDEVFTNIIEDFNSRLVSNLLQQLVAKGLIESSYSTEDNDFIFWVKEDNEDEIS